MIFSAFSPSDWLMFFGGLVATTTLLCFIMRPWWLGLACGAFGLVVSLLIFPLMMVTR